MKKFFTYTVIVIMLITTSCSDVLDIDLNNSDPRLVIDAYLELEENGTTIATVKLSRTSSFFEEENPLVSDATVFVTEDNGTVHDFTVVNNNEGIYSNSTINLQDNVAYTLTIIDQGNNYSSTETLQRTVPFNNVEQETIDGFGDEITEITAFFDDPTGLGDFYLFKYLDVNNDQIDIIDDQFTDGNRSQTTFFIEEAETGVNATISILGIDQRCFNFYETLFQQAEDGGGGPFATQPAVVRGNIINTTDEELFPLGYFRISERFEIEYTLQ